MAPGAGANPTAGRGQDLQPSAWRKDLLAVNGFDESYAGIMGLEDSDLVIRLLTPASSTKARVRGPGVPSLA